MKDEKWQHSIWRRQSIKLSGMLSVVVIVSAVLSLYSVWELKRLDDQRDLILGQLLDQKQVALAAEVAFRQSIQDWKNILIRGHDPKDRPVLIKTFETSSQAAVADLNRLQEMIDVTSTDDSLAPKEAQSAKQLCLQIQKSIIKNSKYYTKQLPEGKFMSDLHSIDNQVKGLDRPISFQLLTLSNTLDQDLRIRSVLFKHRLAVRFIWIRSLIWSALGITVILVGLIVTHFNLKSKVN
jgi:hypothetical protein